MSLWFRRKDREGRVHWYSVQVSILAVLVLIAVVAALVLSFVQWLRTLL